MAGQGERVAGSAGQGDGWGIREDGGIIARAARERPGERPAELEQVGRSVASLWHCQA
jgi:hypothetical protein